MGRRCAQSLWLVDKQPAILVPAHLNPSISLNGSGNRISSLGSQFFLGSPFWQKKGTCEAGSASGD